MMDTKPLVVGVVALVVAATGSLALAGPLVPVAVARQQAQGTTVTVEGLVTVAPGTFTSSADPGFALQDQTGGIWVSLTTSPRLRVGERVQVTGTLGENQQKLQIVADAADVEPLPGKKLQVATGEVGPATLGFLVTVEGTITQPVHADLPYGYSLLIDDGSGPVQVYINASTNIDPKGAAFKPGRTIRVTGFGNQYGSTYEVDPRTRGDVERIR